MNAYSYSLLNCNIYSLYDRLYIPYDYLTQRAMSFLKSLLMEAFTCFPCSVNISRNKVGIVKIFPHGRQRPVYRLSYIVNTTWNHVWWHKKHEHLEVLHWFGSPKIFAVLEFRWAISAAHLPNECVVFCGYIRCYLMMLLISGLYNFSVCQLHICYIPC